jgi:phosphate acyltransferase
MPCAASATRRCASVFAGARRQSRRLRHRRQHRRCHGNRQDGVGRIPGVDRPALAAVFPTAQGTATILIDVGANVDSKPQNLQQFAIMGDIYFRSIFSGRFPSAEHPRVGLLSIGEEESKGNDLTREAYKLIKELPMNFVGNVEGRDLYNGKADVLVCDGFVGNVALKISEGMVETVRFLLKQSLQATITSQVGFLLSRKAFADFKKRLDYSEYGGAPLLGIKGVCIVSHGSSNSNAIKNAIRVAMEYANSKLNHTIEERIAAASRNLNHHATESADAESIGTGLV